MKASKKSISIALLSAVILILMAGFLIEKNNQSDAHQALNPGQKTIYYGIRHAEKDRTDPGQSDPELTAIGLQRARYWATYFDSIPLTGIYSTAYKRTLQTILPTAATQELNPKIYTPSNLITEDFLSQTKGGVWLISGHSNTIPNTINALMKHDSLTDIPDHENSRLYRVVLSNQKISLDIITLPLSQKIE
jgi:2,3-bisphosphoglycerate-dependent phosphoglycerate mutase